LLCAQSSWTLPILLSSLISSNLESNFVALDVGDGGLQFLTNLEAGLAGPLLGLVLWVLVVLL
jgi:hypothetical protein